MGTSSSRVRAGLHRAWGLGSLVLPLVVLLAACTGEMRTPGPSPGAPTAEATTPSPAAPTAEPTTPSPEPGTLVLHVDRQCCYFEGALFFLKVRDEAGVLLLDRTFEESTFRFRVPLPPGRYTVLTYEIPCPGGCPPPDEEGPLGPGTSRCKRTIEIEPGGRHRLEVVTGPGIAGCAP